MPIDYVIIPEIDLCYARWRGVIGHAEVVENFARFLAEPLYRPGRPELIDLREITGFDVEMAEMRRFLSRVNAQDFPDGAGTLTVVLAVNQVSYGHARQYQTLASMRDGIEVKVHRDEQAALRALSRPETSIKELLDIHAPDFAVRCP